MSENLFEVFTNAIEEFSTILKKYYGPFWYRTLWYRCNLYCDVVWYKSIKTLQKHARYPEWKKGHKNVNTRKE